MSDLCSKLRPQYTRISPEFLTELEEVVKIMIREKIVFSKSKKKEPKIKKGCEMQNNKTDWKTRELGSFGQKRLLYW